MIHLYGVVEGLEELPPGLERRRVDGLELVLAREERAPETISREAVLRHAEVVEQLMRRSAAVLPAQLGRAFRDDDELEAAVRHQAPQLARTLERVRGCVEFGLRVTGLERDTPDADSGAGYMRARLDHLRRQDDLIERLHEPLARLARATTLKREPDGVNAAYLVERATVPAFEAAAARAEHTEDAVVVCTGPWPPYSFAGGES
jgi:hypothetical protein